MCFWCGIMNILEQNSVLNKFGKMISPFVKRIFPEIKEESDSYKNIILNITSNMLRIRKCSYSIRFEGNG